MTVLGLNEKLDGRDRFEAPLLVVNSVTLRFGGVIAIGDVSFEVRNNELFAIIGPNGAGKTSILNCLNAVYRPQEGSIKLKGVELVGLESDARSPSSDDGRLSIGSPVPRKGAS